MAKPITLSVFRFQNSITFFLGQRIQKNHFSKKFFPKLTPGLEYLNREVKASAKVLSCLLSCVDVVDQAGPAAALIQNKCSLPIFSTEHLFVEHSFVFPTKTNVHHTRTRICPSLRDICTRIVDTACPPLRDTLIEHLFCLSTVDVHHRRTLGETVKEENGKGKFCKHWE